MPAEVSPLERTTHQHLLSVILTEATARFAPGSVVRILDAGCGNGHLLADLLDNLRRLDPTRTYELHGFDVHDWEYGEDEMIAQTVAYLTERCPGESWSERVTAISARAAWPYPDRFFDVIVSNQVVEHVADHDLFFGQIKRTLRPGGFSVHLFPSRHTIYEVHLGMPFVHWLARRAALETMIGALTRLGFGHFRRSHAETGISPAEFRRRNAEFISRFTNYKTTGQLLRLGRAHGLRSSFCYTAAFYAAKIRQKLGRAPVLRYNRRRAPLRDWLALQTLKHVSGVTLFFDNEC